MSLQKSLFAEEYISGVPGVQAKSQEYTRSTSKIFKSTPGVQVKIAKKWQFLQLNNVNAFLVLAPLKHLIL